MARHEYDGRLRSFAVENGLQLESAETRHSDIDEQAAGTVSIVDPLAQILRRGREGLYRYPLAVRRRASARRKESSSSTIVIVGVSSVMALGIGSTTHSPDCGRIPWASGVAHKDGGGQPPSDPRPSLDH